MKHWRRKLKGGLLEAHFDDGQGDTARVFSGEPWMVDHLQEMFERSTGCKLPEPEWKQPSSPAVAA